MEIIEKNSDAGTTVFLADIGETSLWAIVKLRNGENAATGFCGNAYGDSLATVTPFTAVGAYPSILQEIGICAMSAVGSVPVVEEKGASRKGGMEDQLIAWSSFLSGKEAGAGAREEVREFVIPEEKRIMMTQSGFLAGAGESYRAITTGALRFGNPVSGFDALNIQKAVSAAIPSVRIPMIDVDLAREALKSVFRPTSNAVQWYGTPGLHAEDRPQAARSFPILAGMIADQFSLARAVDRRDSLQDALITASGIGKGGLKRLQKIATPLDEGKLFEDGNVHGHDALNVDRARRINVSGVVSLETAMRHLAKLPPDRIPQDDSSWKIYGNILGGVAIPLEYALGVPVEKTLGACTGDWAAFHASLARSAGFTPEQFDRRTIALTTIDAIQVIDDFSRSVLMPRLLSSIEETGQEAPPVSHEFINTALRLSSNMILGSSKNVAGGLFETSRRYVGRINALMEIMAPEVDEDKRRSLEWSHYGAESFPHLLQEFHASNGLVIRPLLDFTSMKRESARLGHCVGRLYLSKAKNHDCHIFSVQNAEGSKSLSTIELSAARGENIQEILRDLRIIQHRAKQNGVPPGIANEACDQWLTAVKSGKLMLNLDESQRWRERRAEAGPEASITVSWASALEMDWTKAENRDAAWKEWAVIVGGSLGKSPVPDVVYREADVRKLLRDMNPQAAKILEDQAVERRKAQEAGAETAPAP